MAVVLYAIGAFATVAGVAMIGFGIPVNEFSFGNTLIMSGVTSAVGGMIVAALGVVVAQLQHLSDALASRSPARPPRPLDNMFGSGASRDMTAVPFPPKTKAAPYPFEPRVESSLTADRPDDEPHSFAPVLRNPEESETGIDDDISLSPQHPMGPKPGEVSPPGRLDEQSEPEMPASDDAEMMEHRPEPAADAAWRSSASIEARKSHTTYFDAMWPANDKPGKNAEPRDDKATAAFAAPAPEAAEEEPEPRSAAILKSGVVDGMAYTLYVDGSIEAELPQGTLHFASINELRRHLEKSA